MDAVLDVKDLRTYFRTDDGIVKAVDGVSLTVGRGEVLGIVGESGCGKSVTCLSAMRLLQSPPAEYPSGEIYIEGTEVLRGSEEVVRRLRGNRISMVFQEPMTSLNPVLTVGFQIAEVLIEHKGMSQKEAMDEAEAILSQVGIGDVKNVSRRYPHELSGGMRQRVMIGMAIACSPSILLADEPTTALDVTIQAQILQLLMSMREKTGMALVIVTHDLGVVAGIASRVVVMYAGKVVEEALVDDLFYEPLHPYTKGLLTCIPRMNRISKRLDVIPGSVPHPLDHPTGCRFHPRCVYASPRCQLEEPPLVAIGANRKVACWLLGECE